MDNKTIVEPFWSKIPLLIIDLIMIGLFIGSFLNEGLNFRGDIVLGLFIVFLMFLTIGSFTTYQFKFYYILVKYPFGIIKKYDIEDVIGYIFDTRGDSTGLRFIIYLGCKTLYITLSGDKSINTALEFFNENYERIKNKNIEKIINDAIEININKRNKLRFFKERFELIKGTKINIYYYNKDISKIELSKFVSKKLLEEKTLIIRTYDGKKLKLSDGKCKGGIGLFEYLIENIKCGNGT
jgi:hypothetical protein